MTGRHQPGRKTRKYFSSINYLCGEIPCYDIVIDDSFERACPVIRQEKVDGVTFPERQDRLVVCLVRQEAGDFQVRQLYADELFTTIEDAAQDCVRRIELLTELLNQDIRRLGRRKEHWAEFLQRHK